MKKENRDKLDSAIAASREAQQHAILLLTSIGETIDLNDWVTIKEYAKRFDLESTNVVSNWIRRGIIPKDNIKDFPEFNNIRLIKAIPYRVLEPA